MAEACVSLRLIVELFYLVSCVALLFLKLIIKNKQQVKCISCSYKKINNFVSLKTICVNYIG